MKTNTLIITATVTLVMSLAACSKKDNKGAPASPAAKTAQTANDKTPTDAQSAEPGGPKAVDAQCPQNIEGEWNIHTYHTPTGAFSSWRSPYTTYESVQISRNEEGVLQLSQRGMVAPIVFDGQARVIGLTWGKYSKSASGKGATFSAKCANDVIYISEKSVVNKLGDETSKQYEYFLDGNELTGLVKVTANGETLSTQMMSKTPVAPAPVNVSELGYF